MLLLGFLRCKVLLYVQKGGLASGPDDADSSCGKRLRDYVTTDSCVWRGEMQVLVTEVFTKNQVPQKGT